MKSKSIVILSSVLILILSLTMFCACDNSDAPDTPTDDSLRLSDVIPWLNELSADDVTEIRTTSGYYGVVPGTPIDVTTITGETISSFLNAYKNATVAEKEFDYIDGGGYTTVKFTLSSGETKVLSISNGDYHDTANDKYYSVKVPRDFNGDDVISTYAFSVYEPAFPVYKNDSKIGSITDVGDWRFTFADAPASASNAPTHKIVVDFGNILIYNDTLFCMQDTEYWFELYDMTFTEILSRMSAEA